MKLLSSFLFLLIVGCSSKPLDPPIQQSHDDNQSKGSRYYYQGKFGSALFAYEQSLRMAEVLNNRVQIAENSIRIANIYRQKQQFSKAREYYQYALKNIPQEIIDHISDDSISRAFLVAQYGLLQLLLNKGELPLEQAENLTRLLEQVPNDPGWKNKLIVDMQITQALLLKNNNQFAEALIKLEQAETIIQANQWFRKQAAIWLNRAGIAFRQGQYELAREQSEKALLIDQKQENLIGIKADLQLLKQIAVANQNQVEEQQYQQRINYINQRLQK